MAYDTSFNGRVYDTGSGHELIVENGRVTARVLPGNSFVVDEKTGAGFELAPGQTYVVTKGGHVVVLNPNQEWVETPGNPTIENPAGGFVRNKETTGASA